MQTMDENVTLAEAVLILTPQMTPAHLSALVFIAGIQPTGTRRTGARGRPPSVYSLTELQQAHAIEATRTAKQFTDSDWIASALLARGLAHADTAAGIITWASDGSRAEKPDRAGYGLVYAGQAHCQAHRLIWIATDGEIPVNLQVNHINHRRWDNRRANLELVTFVENLRHRSGQPYLTYHDAVAQLADLAPSENADPPQQDLIPVGGAFRHAYRNGGVFRHVHR